MRKKRTKNEELRVYMTTPEKNQVRRLAGIANKNMSEYMLGAALVSALDTGKLDFFTSISNDLATLNKNILIVTNMMLFIATQNQPIPENQILGYYSELEKDL